MCSPQRTASRQKPKTLGVFMRVLAVVSCLTLSVVSVADPPAATAAMAHRIDIPPQKLGPALRALAREQGFQIVYGSKEVSQLNSPGAVGEFTPAQALEQLLSGTGLTYRYVDEKTVTIVSPKSTSTSQAPRSAGGDATTLIDTNSKQQEARSPSFWDRFRLAQVDQGAASQGGSLGNAAPQAEPKPSALEEIVVTAQKRAERLKDVPVSISVLSGSDLDRSSVAGIRDALNRVPGVATTVGFQGGGTQIAVRGVTANGPNFSGASPIAYYLDSVPFGFVRSASTPDTNAYDLDRVEVLRGPQGTLYGASAQNGVVRVLTKDANLTDYEFKARASGSDTDRGSLGYRADMALNAPLIEGKLAARLVVGYEDLPGWIDRPKDDNANNGEVRQARLKINGQPTDQLSVGASAWVSRSDFGAPPTGTADGRNTSTSAEPMSTDYDAYSLKVGYDLAAFSLSSMTSYLDYNNEGYIDYGNLGLRGTRLYSRFKSRVWSEEVNLHSTSSGPWRWSAGGIYRDDKDLTSQFRPQYLAPNAWDDFSRSWAAFGELTRVFLDGRLELTGGLRYFRDDTHYQELSRTSGVPASQLVTSSPNFDKISPRGVLTWHPSDQLTTYASYAEGFRSGYSQLGAVLAVAAQFPPVKSDNLKNYELGIKGDLWDRRVSFDTSVYYIDWQGVQQTVTTNVGTAASPINLGTAINGSSASGLGVDFAVTTRPVSQLTLGVNLSWNDLTMDEDVVSGTAILFHKGDRLQLSPEYTVGTSGEYSMSLGSSGYKGNLAVSANYTSSQQLRSVTTVTRGDNILIARASFAVVAPSHWELTLFVDNLTNDDGFPVKTILLVPNWDLRVQPRTVGLQLDYHL
jgi:iron complex outermembrane recepter protein